MKRIMRMHEYIEKAYLIIQESLLGELKMKSSSLSFCKRELAFLEAINKHQV